MLVPNPAEGGTDPVTDQCTLYSVELQAEVKELTHPLQVNLSDLASTKEKCGLV